MSIMPFLVFEPHNFGIKPFLVFEPQIDFLISIFNLANDNKIL